MVVRFSARDPTRRVKERSGFCLADAFPRTPLRLQEGRSVSRSNTLEHSTTPFQARKAERVFELDEEYPVYIPKIERVFYCIRIRVLKSSRYMLKIPPVSKKKSSIFV